MIRQFGAVDLLYLAGALRWTVALTLAGFAGGALLGLVVAVMRVSGLAPLRWLAVLYVQTIQGTPLLVILFVFFFGLSIFGLPVLPWIAAALAFSIYAGAFLGEIWRGALESIPRTQWEARSASASASSCAGSSSRRRSASRSRRPSASSSSSSRTRRSRRRSASSS
jgi:polar amino acid transport system permease protein